MRNYFFWQQKITALDIIAFFRQLATLSVANISIIQSIEMLQQSQTNPLLKTILSHIKHHIERGNYVSSSLAKFPDYFDHLTCSLLKIGEQSGTFSKVLLHIASHKEKYYLIKNKIKRSLFYPMMISIIACIVCCIMLLFIVPKFSQLFQEMHTPLPFFTLVILHLSTLLQAYGFLILLLPLCWYILFPTAKHQLKALFLNLPIIHTLIKKMLLINFTHYLSITIKAGLPISDSLALIAKSIGNDGFAHELLLLKTHIEKGNKIHSSIQNNPRFPHLFIAMVKIGEESGTLDYMLEKICIHLENELDQQVSYLSDLLEPLIMVILGVLIGGLVVAMYLPIFKLGTVL